MSARIILAAAIATAAFATVPAYATTGRDAVGMCIDNQSKGCVWLMDNKGQIEIITGDNRYITCPDAKSQCTLHRKVLQDATPSARAAPPAAPPTEPRRREEGC